MFAAETIEFLEESSDSCQQTIEFLREIEMMHRKRRSSFVFFTFRCHNACTVARFRGLVAKMLVLSHILEAQSHTSDTKRLIYLCFLRFPAEISASRRRNHRSVNQPRIPRILSDPPDQVSLAAACDHPTTRAGGEDYVSSKQTPSNNAVLDAMTQSQSKGFPCTRYFIPVCVGVGVGSSENVCSVVRILGISVNLGDLGLRTVILKC